MKKLINILILFLLPFIGQAQITNIFDFNTVEYKTINELGKYEVDAKEHQHNRFMFHGLYAKWMEDENIDKPTPLNIIFDNTKTINGEIVFIYKVGENDLLVIPEDGSFMALYYNKIGQNYINALIFKQ